MHSNARNGTFSGLEADELIPALLWEVRREYAGTEEVAMNAQAWLEGRLSTKKPPMPRGRRMGKRPQDNIRFSAAEVARLRATSVFGEFIPQSEFSILHKWNASQRCLEYDRWLSGYLRPLIKNRDVPWLCLPVEERQRLCGIFNRNRNAGIIHVGTWWDAVGHFQQTKPDSGSPLKFDFSEYTSVLLTINWGHSKKRILAAIANILNQFEPPDLTRIKRWDHRGRKDRDLLVKLERFAMMRLLHHYTLVELKRRLPEAWNLYSSRKWYDERRQALLDFRGVIGSREADFFPKHWLTKAHRTRNTPRIPAK